MLGGDVVVRAMGHGPDLLAFDLGQIEGATRMGHSISKVVNVLRFSRTTVASVY